MIIVGKEKKLSHSRLTPKSESRTIWAYRSVSIWFVHRIVRWLKTVHLILNATVKFFLCYRSEIEKETTRNNPPLSRIERSKTRKWNKKIRDPGIVRCQRNILRKNQNHYFLGKSFFKNQLWKLIKINFWWWQTI